MPSLASNIIELHRLGWQRSEIIRATGCTEVYLRSVLSRSSATDAETRKRRSKTGVRTEERRLATNAYKRAYNKALRCGSSTHKARRAARVAYAQIVIDAAGSLDQHAQRRRSDVSDAVNSNKTEALHEHA